jgi:hypothetical protein
MTNLKVIKSGRYTAYTYRDKGQWWFVINDNNNGKSLMRSTAPSKKQMELNVDFYLKSLERNPFVW